LLKDAVLQRGAIHHLEEEPEEDLENEVATDTVVRHGVLVEVHGEVVEVLIEVGVVDEVGAVAEVAEKCHRLTHHNLLIQTQLKW